MTKKLLFSALMLLLNICGFAYDFEVGGIYYDCDASNQTVSVTSSSLGGYRGVVTIPEQVVYNGVTYSVTSISDEAFYLCWTLTSVSLPNSLISIGDGAFYGCI